MQSLVSVHTASIRSSGEALDQSLSGGSGNPLRMTLTLICSFRAFSDMRKIITCAVSQTGDQLNRINVLWCCYAISIHQPISIFGRTCITRIAGGSDLTQLSNVVTHDRFYFADNTKVFSGGGERQIIWIG